MTITRPPEIPDTSLTRDLLHAARYYLGGRRSLFGLAAVALAAGLWLGWPALVAAGIAPILLALAPCAVMCALGLCMGRMGRSPAASRPAGAELQEPSRSTPGPGAQDPALPDAGCAHCEGATETHSAPSATPGIHTPNRRKDHDEQDG